MRTSNICILFLISLFSCKNEDVPSACVNALIERMKNEVVRNPPGKVWQYLYNGRVVYYITPQCCDQPSILIDTYCNKICSPDGGLSGGGDGKCKDLFTTATNPILVWADSRK